MIGNNVADKIANVSRTSPHNGSAAVTNEAKIIGTDREIPKESVYPQNRDRKLLTI